jgi:hypothetical protein
VLRVACLRVDVLERISVRIRIRVDYLLDKYDQSEDDFYQDKEPEEKE